MTARISLSESAIYMENMSYYYENQNANSAFLIPSWQVSKGERLFLHGESGSGKTTLLNLLAGILRQNMAQSRYAIHHFLHYLEDKETPFVPAMLM